LELPTRAAFFKTILHTANSSTRAPTVRLAPLNNDWLKALLEKNPKALHHILIGEQADDRSVVLTAETQEIQQFLRAHLNSEDTWKDSFELRRVAGQ
jgi:hypothetical protein